MGPCPISSRISTVEEDIQTIKDSAGCPCNCVSVDQHLALYDHCIALVQRVLDVTRSQDTYAGTLATSLKLDKPTNNCAALNALVESLRADVAKLRGE